MTATYDFAVTRNKIIDRALRLCGVVAQGNDPTGEQLSEGIEALESLVKFLQADNVFLWTLENRTIPTVIGQAQYNLPTDTLSVAHFFYPDSTGMTHRIGLVDDPTFASIGEPTRTGLPEVAQVEMREAPFFTLWPVPDAIYTINYKATRKMRDFDTSIGTPEAPQRWYDPIIYLLAANLADEYQRPLQERAYLSAKAQAMKNAAAKTDLDPADLLFMCPV